MSVTEASWSGLTPPYKTIVADPPWPYDEGFQGWGERRHLPYSSMSVAEIGDLAISDLADAGAHLYLWTTNRYIAEALSFVTLWGFNYSATLVWAKTPNGKGSGGRFANTTEFVIHAAAPAQVQPRRVERAGALIRSARQAAGLTRGEVFHRVRGGKKTGLVNNWELDICLPSEADWRKLQEVLPALAGVKRPTVPAAPRREPAAIKRMDTTWWNWPRGQHSEKPPAFLDIVEQVSPGPYVELFARAPRLGWDSWGKGYEVAA